MGREGPSESRGGSDTFVVCGPHAVQAFVETRPADVGTVLVEPRSEPPGWLSPLLQTRIRTVERVELDRLAGGVAHQGIIAVGRPPPSLEIAALWVRRPALVLAVDGVTDARNVGALLRSAEAFGAGAAILTRDRAPGLSPGLVKAAAGAVERLPLARVVNLARVLLDARQQGYWTLGLDADGDVDLRDSERLPDPPRILVVGAEGRGLRPLIRSRCDRLVRIGMPGRAESLNAAVAGGIALFALAGPDRPRP